jgi:serine/threonine-protein kinase
VLPTQIGRYEILGQLAVGGMAEILLGRLTGIGSFERAVVIKRILRQYANVASFVKMFLDEARIVARIRHPNVIQVQELGREGEELFLVMEYVAGENAMGLLKRLVSKGQRLDVALAAHIVAEAAAGLHAAHELVDDTGNSLHLVHRDVSPQNLVVTYDGHVKVLDFGIAMAADRIARTEAGQVKGKFEYMSPEQTLGEALDRRSDVFSLGIVLYELVTSRRLYQRGGHAKVLQAINTEPLVPPSRIVEGIPEELDDICLRALAHERDERYATAAEMRRDLLDLPRELKAPTEALAKLMRDLFAERIAEKEEMLRRVRHGDPLTHIPLSEVDTAVEVPNATDIAPPPTAAALTAQGGRASRRRARWLLLASCGLGIIGAAFFFARRPAAAPAPRPVEATALPTPAPPPLPAEIVVHIETTPSGVQVRVRGEDRGETPIDLHLPRGEAPVPIDLERRGYGTLSQSIVPDADQRMMLSLQPAASPRHGATRPPHPAAAASGGFRRFD